MLDWQCSLILWPKRFNTKNNQIPHVFLVTFQEQKKIPPGYFSAFFSEENSPELRTDLGTWGCDSRYFTLSVEKASSGNQNLGTPSCKMKKVIEYLVSPNKIPYKNSSDKKLWDPKPPKAVSNGETILWCHSVFFGRKVFIKGYRDPFAVEQFWIFWTKQCCHLPAVELMGMTTFAYLLCNRNWATFFVVSLGISVSCGHFQTITRYYWMWCYTLEKTPASDAKFIEPFARRGGAKQDPSNQILNLCKHLLYLVIHVEKQE